MLSKQIHQTNGIEPNEYINDPVNGSLLVILINVGFDAVQTMDGMLFILDVMLVCHILISY